MSSRATFMDTQTRRDATAAAIKTLDSGYAPPPEPLDYYAPLPPLAEHPLLELRRPENKDAFFAVSAITPGLPLRLLSEQEPPSTTLLDRYLYQQEYHPSSTNTGLSPIPVFTRTSIPPAEAMPNLWSCTQTPLSPGNPRNVWAFMSNGQWIPPPPPPGPPPGNGGHSRVNQIVAGIGCTERMAGHNTFDAYAGSMSSSSPPARGHHMKEQTFVSNSTETPFTQHIPACSSQAQETALVVLPPATKKIPISINIQAARDDAMAKLEGCAIPPGSANTAGSTTPRGRFISPGRRVMLSPINTQVIESEAGRSFRVDVLVSPIMSPVLSDPKSPFFSGRNSRSSTPPLWSPKTPVAMSFRFPVIIDTGTPPPPSLEWLDSNRETIIEDDIQDETPLDIAPARGLVCARVFTRGSSPPLRKHSLRRARARSISPPRSAFPDDSSFNWSPKYVHNRYSTDEDFGIMTPSVEPKQMIEVPSIANSQMPNCHNASDGNPRQTILGTYFKRPSLESHEYHQPFSSWSVGGV